MLQSYQVLIEHSQLKWPDTPPTVTKCSPDCNGAA